MLRNADRIVFFFKGSANHRDLTASPPRHPADLPLTSPVEETVATAVSLDAQVTARPVSSVPAESRRTAVSWTESPVVTDTRSEEHTSELQSRQYLVCRLLLEKKKHRLVRPSGDA